MFSVFSVHAMCSGDPAFDFRSERPVVLPKVLSP
jgi:hypothetical protein